ncbi:MAG: aldo/keto reductase [Candidatus Binatia bacterium]|nr:aldo/keto reductase [Candidatus Binatia bacterium]
MKERRLGRSALSVSEICLGTMTFGSMADERDSLAILDRAYEAGVNFLDVAEIYPVPPDTKWAGASEEIVGKWLHDKPRDSLFVATKIAGPGGGWFQTPVRGGNTALDRHSVERALDASLRKLGTDYVDLYQTHWPDRILPAEEQMEALDRAVQAGKVRVLGCSNESAYGLTKLLWASDILGAARHETIQNNFSLLNRRFEDGLSEVCRAEKVSLLPYSPLGGGVLSGKYQGGAFPEGARFTYYRNHSPRTKFMADRFVNERSLETTAQLAAVAEKAGISVVTLSIAWTLTHPFVGSTIIGATNVDQLDECLAAAKTTLSPEVLAECDRITRAIPYPLG